MNFMRNYIVFKEHVKSISQEEFFRNALGFGFYEFDFMISSIALTLLSYVKIAKTIKGLI